MIRAEMRDVMWPGHGGEEVFEGELPYKPAGHGEIAVGSVSACSPFWRTFVRSSVVMQWIEEGYRMLWAVQAPPSREMPNSPSAREHREFVSNAVAEMTSENAVTKLPPGEKPWVVSPLGVVPKRGTDKFRLTVNMRYVNSYLGKKSLQVRGVEGLGRSCGKGGPRGFL